MREELASLGTILSEQDFSAIILGSLPKSYDQFLSAVRATASVLKQDLDPEDLMQTIIDEYDQRSTRQGNSKEKGSDTVFFAGNNHGKTEKRLDKDIECFNCHKKGHKKADCWAKGGGKEGHGPKSKLKRRRKNQRRRWQALQRKMVYGWPWLIILMMRTWLIVSATISLFQKKSYFLKKMKTTMSRTSPLVLNDSSRLRILPSILHIPLITLTTFSTLTISPICLMMNKEQWP